MQLSPNMIRKFQALQIFYIVHFSNYLKKNHCNNSIGWYNEIDIIKPY